MIPLIKDPHLLAAFFEFCNGIGSTEVPRIKKNLFDCYAASDHRWKLIYDLQVTVCLLDSRHGFPDPQTWRESQEGSDGVMPTLAPRQEEARPPALGNGPRSNPTRNSGKITAHFPLNPFTNITNKTHTRNTNKSFAPKHTGPSIHLTPLDRWNNDENYPRKIQMTLDGHVAGRRRRFPRGGHHCHPQT